MSLATWMAEFYPVDADTVPKDDNLKLLAHSLRKWIGLMPKALEKHGVRVLRGVVQNMDYSGGLPFLPISAATCALCRAYTGCGDCGDCPIQVATNYCLSYPTKLWDDSIKAGYPYGIFAQTGNPRPMIKVLAKAYEAEYQHRRTRAKVRRIVKWHENNPDYIDSVLQAFIFPILPADK